MSPEFFRLRPTVGTDRPTRRKPCVPTIWGRACGCSMPPVTTTSPCPARRSCRPMSRCCPSRTWHGGSTSPRRRSPGGVTTASSPSGTTSEAGAEWAFCPAPSSGSSRRTPCGSSAAAGSASSPPRSTRRSSAGRGGWQWPGPVRPTSIGGSPSGSAAAWRRSATRSSGTTRSIPKRPFFRPPTGGSGRRAAPGFTSIISMASRWSRSPGGITAPRPASTG